jgi:hypothetical protein
MSMNDLAGRKAFIKTSGLKAGRILDILLNPSFASFSVNPKD